MNTNSNEEAGSEEYFRQLHDEFIASLSGPADDSDDDSQPWADDDEFERLLEEFIADFKDGCEPDDQDISR